MGIKNIEYSPAFFQLVETIKTNPQSWLNWSCLTIEEIKKTSLSEKGDDGSHILLESYFEKVCDRMFRLDNKAYLFFKSIPIGKLHQLAVQISGISIYHQSLFEDYKIYDFSKGDTEEFFRDIQIEYADFFEEKEYVSSEITDIGSYNPSVLLVEDDPIVRMMVRSVLKDKCRLATATSAKTAYELFDKWNPDLVFLDIGLPDKSGHEVLEWMLEKRHTAKIVMFSGNDSLDNIAGTLAQGAIGFVAKPFLKSDILQYIEGNQKQVS